MHRVTRMELTDIENDWFLPSFSFRRTHMPRKQSRSAPSRTRQSSKKAKAKAKTSTLIRWSGADDKQLKMLIKQNTPTRVIGQKLKRTEASVRQHAYRMGISLRPSGRR